MWSVPVVMFDERLEDPFQVLLVENQQPVETLRADGAHKSLGGPVGLWRATWRPHDLYALGSEHVVKTISKFLIPIANQKSHRLRTLCQDPGQLPRLLNDPGRVRIRRATGHMHTAAAQLDEEEHGQPLQPDRFDCEEIDRQQAVPVRPYELAPGYSRVPAGWPETRYPKPRAHGRR